MKLQAAAKLRIENMLNVKSSVVAATMPSQAAGNFLNNLHINPYLMPSSAAASDQPTSAGSGGSSAGSAFPGFPPHSAGPSSAGSNRETPYANGPLERTAPARRFSCSPVGGGSVYGGKLSPMSSSGVQYKGFHLGKYP